MDNLIKKLTSMQSAVVILILIIATSIVGTVMKQEVASRVIYHSLWYQGLLLILSLIILYCRVLKFTLNKKLVGSYLLHLGILIIIGGAFVSFVFGDSGFVSISEGEHTNIARRADNSEILLPFQLRLNDFILEQYAGQTIQHLDLLDKTNKPVFSTNLEKPAVFQIDALGQKLEVLSIYRDFVIADKTIKNRSENWNNPAILVKVGDKTGFVFARYQAHSTLDLGDYHLIYHLEQYSKGIKDFKSALTVIDKGKEVVHKTIEVNNPLKYAGYTLYQSSYDADFPEWTGLRVKKDPGVLIVYAGSLLLIIGIFMHLFFRVI